MSRFCLLPKGCRQGLRCGVDINPSDPTPRAGGDGACEHPVGGGRSVGARRGRQGAGGVPRRWGPSVALHLFIKNVVNGVTEVPRSISLPPLCTPGCSRGVCAAAGGGPLPAGRGPRGGQPADPGLRAAARGRAAGVTSRPRCTRGRTQQGDIGAALFHLSLFECTLAMGNEYCQCQDCRA